MESYKIEIRDSKWHNIRVKITQHSWQWLSRWRGKNRCEKWKKLKREKCNEKTKNKIKKKWKGNMDANHVLKIAKKKKKAERWKRKYDKELRKSFSLECTNAIIQ